MNPNQPSIAILGPGAVGGSIAAAFLLKKFPVICVAREATTALINKDGIRLESRSFGNVTIKPKTVSRLDIEPDILFVTTKAPNLVEALERIPTSLIKKTLIVPLLNGLEHMQILQARYGPKIIAASIRIEAKYLGPNHIVHTSPFFRIEMASDKDVPRGKLEKVAEWLMDVGIETEILPSESQVLWGKLARLNALACTTSASNKPIGFIRTDQLWRQNLIDCVKEGIAVATVDGAQLNFDTIMRTIDELPETLSTSLHRDIIAGRPNELDAIAGAIIRKGRVHGLTCPTIAKMMTLIETRISEKNHL